MIDALESIEKGRTKLHKLLQAAFVSGGLVVGHGCDIPDPNFSDDGDKRPNLVLSELTDKTKSTGDNFETAYLSYCSQDLKTCRTIRKKGMERHVEISSLYKQYQKETDFYGANLVIQYHNHPANIQLGKVIAKRDVIPNPDNLLTGPSGWIDCVAGEGSPMFEFVVGKSKFVSVLRDPGGVWLCRPNYEINKIAAFDKYKLAYANKELNESRIKLIEESQFGTSDMLKRTIEEFTRMAPEKFGIEVEFLSNEEASDGFEDRVLAFANKEPLFAPVALPEK